MHKADSYHAREFSRTFERNQPKNVEVVLEKRKSVLLKRVGDPNKNDHKILNTAAVYHARNKTTKVVLVTNDINLRMKARAIGITAEGYSIKKNTNVQSDEYRTVEVDYELIEEIHKNGSVVIPEELIVQTNEYLILQAGTMSALAKKDEFEEKLVKVEKQEAAKIYPKNSEQTFAMDALLNHKIKIATLNGKAGTGKTLLAVAAAIQQQKHYKNIIIARPIVPLSGNDIGYLPGDIDAKIGPYMAPLYDSLGIIKKNYDLGERLIIQEMVNKGVITICPLAYIRGRSVSDTFFIIDEAQNLTKHEIKTIVTRAGEGTKMIFTGDVSQIDHQHLNDRNNGLTYLAKCMYGQKIFANINLRKTERSELAELASDLL